MTCQPICEPIRLAAAALGLLFVQSAALAQVSAVTASQFAVTESGAATIGIPIQVPRGIGGMEPQLSLNYSSGGANGLLGQGWTLQGPSSITRCPKTPLIDGARGAVTFGEGDRYCLDGQRLILIDPASPNAAAPSQTNYGAAGTEYRTERESWSRIRAVGSYGAQATVPRGFTAETKSGLRLEFGNVADANDHSSMVPTKASAQASGAPATINRWMLRRIADRTGSFVEFEYCRGEVTSPDNFLSSSCDTSKWSGSAPIHHIRYTNRNSTLDGTSGVVFMYGARPDINESFHYGTSMRQTQRMTGIRTYVGYGGPGTPGTPVRTYEIAYEPFESGGTSLRTTTASRLAAIQERAADGSTLPALQFTLAADTVMDKVVALRPAAVPTPNPRVDGCGGVVANKIAYMCN